MPTSYVGSNHFPTTVAVPADGDPANGAAFVGVQDLADRTRALLLSNTPAIARHSIVELSAGADRFLGIAWGERSGYLNQGLWCAVGPRSGGGAAVALSSNNGDDWYVYGFPSLVGGFLVVTPRGVAHGVVSFAVCGEYIDGGVTRPIILSAADAADANASPLVPEIASASFALRFDGNVSGLTGRLNSITFTSTGFCAVGDTGLIVTLSADLATSAVRTPGSSYTGNFRHVFADSAGRLFACGDSGEIQRSVDNGVTWTRVFSDSSLGALASGVAITVGGVESLVVGVSANDENRVLRSTNAGASTSWAEVSLISAAVFNGGPVLVHKLGSMLGAVLRSRHNAAVNRAFYSLDGGATWPYTMRPAFCVGSSLVASGQNGQRVMLVGGTPDGTGAGHVFASMPALAAL